MKKFFYLFVATLVLTSCSDQEESIMPEQSLAEGIVAGFSDLDIDFTKPIVYNFSSEEEKESILAQIASDVYAVEPSVFTDKNGNRLLEELSVDIAVNKELGQITVNPAIIQKVL